MANLNYGSISDPAMTIESLHRTVTELKQAVEILTGQRSSPNNESFVVTQEQLVSLGVAVRGPPGQGIEKAPVTTYATEAYVDAADDLDLKKVGNQTVTGGFNLTPFSLGNITSFTIAPLSGNYQYGTNHGAATWTAPASDCAVDILVTNDASAGTITFSGFTVSAVTGDALTTTNTNKFIISIRRINSVSTYLIKALQ